MEDVEIAPMSAIAPTVRVETMTAIPLPGGMTTWYSFCGLPSQIEDTVAIFFGGDPHEPPLVRIHSSCLTGDRFESLLCDCGAQLDQAVELLHENGGWLIYHDAEGRGIGLRAKLKAYELQRLGRDTIDANVELGLPADGRDFTVIGSLLRCIGVTKIKRLLTNNPAKTEQLVRSGIAVEQVMPTGVFVEDTNREYLLTKRKRCGHNINLNQAC